MDSEEIRMELFKRRKRISMSKIALEVGVSRQAVTAVIQRKFVSRRIQAAVAKAIERDPKYVFPETFLKRNH
jgi:lambda repressor-like predicted transcriptional regulator